jgi:hypothetical protein
VFRLSLNPRGALLGSLSAAQRGGAKAHDVFLSYSYQDKTSADAVCYPLESKGIRCWIAPRDVIPGGNRQQSILDAIAEARAVILLFTGHTN